MLGIVRIAGRSRMEIGEFGGDGLADDHGTGVAQPLDHMRVLIGPAPGQERRAAFGRIVAGVDDVLDPDRNAVQRTQRHAPALALVERARLRDGMVGIEMGEGADFRIDRGDTVEAGAGIFLGRDRAARDFGYGMRGSPGGEIGCGHVQASVTRQISRLARESRSAST